MKLVLLFLLFGGTCFGQDLVKEAQVVCRSTVKLKLESTGKVNESVLKDLNAKERQLLCEKAQYECKYQHLLSGPSKASSGFCELKPFFGSSAGGEKAIEAVFAQCGLKRVDLELSKVPEAILSLVESEREAMEKNPSDAQKWSAKRIASGEKFAVNFCKGLSGTYCKQPGDCQLNLNHQSVSQYFKTLRTVNPINPEKSGN